MMTLSKLIEGRILSTIAISRSLRDGRAAT